MRVLVVTASDSSYALEMASVQEVVARPLITAVPTQPAVLLGLFNLRGEIVPLFDTAMLLGVGATEQVAYAVVVTTARGTAALATESLPETVDIANSEPVQDLDAGGVTYAIDSRLTTLIDIEGVLEGVGASGDRE